MITVDETIEPGKYKLVLDGTEPEPPPTGECECDVKAGTTTTLAAGSEATVAVRKVDKTHFLDIGVPQGIQGIPGPPGSGTGTVTLGKGVVDVRNFGAKGDGTTDDAPAFTAAWNAVRGTGGDVIIPYPDNFYRFNQPMQAIPDGSNQAWVNLKAGGMRSGEIRYHGPSGQAAIKVIGLKGAQWHGLKIRLENGRSNCQAIDIDTTSAAGSSSFNSFHDFYIDLGGTHGASSADARNEGNVGIRTGFVSGGGADISNYNFNNMIVFGNGPRGQSGPPLFTPGQYAFQNLGMNTLSMCWYGGFVACTDRAYTNTQFNGTKRGNGSVAFFGLGGSQNNIDFEFGFEQAYFITGGRWEGGNKLVRISNGAYSSVVIEGLVIHDYKSDNQIEAMVATSLTLKGVQVSKTFGGYYNSCVSLNSPGRPAVLNMQNCAFSLAPTTQLPYTKSGSGQWDITAIGNTRLNGVWTDTAHGFFNNEVGIRK